MSKYDCLIVVDEEALSLSTCEYFNMFGLNTFGGHIFIKLKPLGVLGILERAKELSIIDKVKPFLDILRYNNFRISNSLYENY